MFESKLPGLATSIFTIMSELALKHKALNLSQGFPNFESDAELVRLVNDAMKQGYNQYAPMAGDYDLRVAIANKVNNLYGKAYTPDSEITITAGATQAIFTAISAIVRPKDEVIVFTPAYDCYEPTIHLFEGVSVPIQLTAPHYNPDWELVRTKISAHTKMIIVNSPHNPSGMLFSKDDMLALQELAVEHDLIVISDEVYEHIIFDGNQHQSAARFEELSKRTFITASFGKTFHNTGWKVGYCLAPEGLMREFRKVHQYNVFSVNHPVQKALAQYLIDESTYLNLPNFYQKKRDLFNSLIEGSRFKVVPSQGTYFQLLDFSEISSESDTDFATKLTIEHKIATIPTSVFNDKQQDFHQIRVCFAKTDETLLAATKILNSI